MELGKASTLFEIFLVSARLGLTSFGGPIAHLGYFHEEYVRRRKWLDEQRYADLVALSQFLPGPASSQVGMGIGVMRGGVLGGIISFLGFTLPSVIALIVFALLLTSLQLESAGWIHGLKLVAVAVVAHAIAGMAGKLTPDLPRRSIALLAIAAVLLWQTVYTQVGVIVLAAIAGYVLYRHTKEEGTEQHAPLVQISKRFAISCLFIFFALLVLLPILAETLSLTWLTLFDSFYRSGSLVFGGGHVVLPLLEREFVPSGWLNEEQFLAGYGAAQAVPGPLFTFASYIGAIIGGVPGGLLAASAIFLPAFLLVYGTLPFWDTLRRNPKVKGALMGVNAAVVGILIAAWYHPIWTSTILEPVDFVGAAVLYFMLAYWKLPPWIVVLAGALGGIVISL